MPVARPSRLSCASRLPGPFVAEHEADEVGGLALHGAAQVGQREGQRHAAQVLHRLHAQRAQRRLGRQEVGRVAQLGTLLVGHRAEMCARQLLQHVQRRRAGQRQRHAVGAVVLAMEGQQFFARGAAQRVLVAGAEVARGVAVAEHQVAQRELAPQVVLEVLLVLGIDGVDLALGEARVEQRGDEELRKTVERTVEGLAAGSRSGSWCGRWRCRRCSARRCGRGTGRSRSPRGTSACPGRPCARGSAPCPGGSAGRPGCPRPPPATPPSC
jgi:hypothetical protein